MDISGKVSSKAREDAKIDRERMINPADVEPGMEDDDFWDNMDDPFSDNSGSMGFPAGDPLAGFNNPMGMSPLSPPLGMNPLGMGMPDPMAVGQPQAPKKELEDVLADGAVLATKGFMNFLKAVAEQSKTYSLEKGADMFRYGTILGLILFVVFLVLSIFSKGLLEVSALGAIVAGISIPSFVVCYINIPRDEDGNILQQEPPQDMSDMGAIPSETSFSSGFEMGDMGEMYEEEEPFQDDSDLEAELWENEEEETNEDDLTPEERAELFGGEDDLWETPVQPVSYVEQVGVETGGKFDSLIASIQDRQLMTRQVVFDTMINIMPTYAPTYSTGEEVPAHKEEFDDWDAIIKQSAEVFRPSNGEDKDMPHLIRLEKKLFYYYLIVSRSVWIKGVEKYVDEIVRYVSVDEATGKRDPEITGTGELSGDRIYIRIMQPSSKVIGLRDVMEAERAFFTDPKVEKPVVLGVTEEGKALIQDFKSVNSLLVAGMPRSGKTVEAECIFTQLTMFIPPSEMHIYILDPKDGISDFLSFDPPHVRRFENENHRIVQTLEELVNSEGKKRKDIFREAKVIKIQDYNKKNPNSKLPYIYVIIDEVLTLAESMDKETSDSFQSLLTIIISQLPALGIHLVMIPHVIKDSVISKTTTDLITCRMSVRGTPEHIEKVTGSKPSQFKRKLVNVGDIAINMGTGDSTYAKGVLTALEAEDRQEIMAFVRDFWLKLEPESYVGSYYQKRVQKGETPEPSEYLNLDLTTTMYGSQPNKGQRQVANNSPHIEMPTQALSEVEINTVLEKEDISNHFLK